MTHPALNGMKYYGDTAIGEKGQVVIPAEIRKKFGIETGDRFLVMAGEKMGAWGLILIKANVLSQVVDEIFGGRLDEALTRMNAKRSARLNRNGNSGADSEERSDITPNK